MFIEHSVFPDRDSPPADFPTAGEKADYVHRICGAWDFGILPEARTFELFAGWREVFDEYVLAHSPAYHAFRSEFRWPPVPGSCLEADYERLDAVWGRSDPCTDMI